MNDDDGQVQAPLDPPNNDDNQDDVPVEDTDPPVNSVLSQQMGTDYTDVENLDKQELQQDLKDQGTKPGDVESDIPYGDGVDDRFTSDGQG